MGSSEIDKPAKENDGKAQPVTSQEHSSATCTGTVNPEWSGFQAYSPIPPHGFMASSPQAHPYMWGVQPIMPPYGTPAHPYVAMYPHSGIYTHPSIPPGSYPFSPFAMPTNGIAEASGNSQCNVEAEGKTEVKEKLPIKRSKGSLGSLSMLTGKNNDLGKTLGASSNGIHSKSAESVSEGSSEGSDANSQNESQMKSGSRQGSLEAEASQNGTSAHGPQNGGSSTPHTTMNQAMAIVPISSSGAPTSGSGPTTNLNIGMDYWGSPASTTIPALRGKVPSALVAGGIVPTGSCDSLQSQPWIQDERELKKQRRKQSNRESARRSRLRKQAECDELAHRAENLKEENASLRAELSRIRSEYEQLLSENISLKERLGEVPSGEDLSSTGNDQHTGNDNQQSGQTEHR